MGHVLRYCFPLNHARNCTIVDDPFFPLWIASYFWHWQFGISGYVMKAQSFPYLGGVWSPAALVCGFNIIHSVSKCFLHNATPRMRSNDVKHDFSSDISVIIPSEIKRHGQDWTALMVVRVVKISPSVLQSQILSENIY